VSDPRRGLQRHATRRIAQRPLFDRLFVRAVAERFPGGAENVRSGIRTGEEELLGPHVGRREEERATGGQAVASGAADLLVIRLERARHVGVRHEAQVALVDPHAEGVGGGDHLDAAREEIVLHAGALVVPQPAVVLPRPEAPLLEMQSPQRHVLPGRRVDDAGRPRVPQQRLEGARLVAARPQRLHREGQVRALEAGDHFERPLQTELARDVGPDFGSGGGGERRGRHAEDFAQLSQARVVGAEVMPPLADAVRLVHDQPRHARPRERRAEPRLRQPLGRDIEQRQLSLHEGTLRGGALGPAHPGMDRRGGQAARLQSVHLVLHQRDERRDHHGRAGQEHRRQLEAERLAGAGRHHRHDVLSIEDRGRDLFLPRPEGFQAEAIAQRRLERRCRMRCAQLGTLRHGRDPRAHLYHEGPGALPSLRLESARFLL
jgi:hypothetical protein